MEVQTAPVPREAVERKALSRPLSMSMEESIRESRQLPAPALSPRLVAGVRQGEDRSTLYWQAATYIDLAAARAAAQFDLMVGTGGHLRFASAKQNN